VSSFFGHEIHNKTECMLRCYCFCWIT
jgi:hypothetical protein